MQTDLFLTTLLIVLGAMIAYALDERYAFTPRLAAWLDSVFED
jgi:hypothetical protein